MAKRWLSLVLVLALVFGGMQTAVFAGEPEDRVSEEDSAAVQESDGDEDGDSHRDGRSEDAAQDDVIAEDDRDDAQSEGSDPAPAQSDPEEDGETIVEDDDAGEEAAPEESGQTPSAGDPVQRDDRVVITAEDVSVARGDRGFDLLDGVRAQDGAGNRYSLRVQEDGGFDVDLPGDYTVRYVTDDEALDEEIAAERTVTVAEEEPVFAYDPQPGSAAEVRALVDELQSGNRTVSGLPRWAFAVDGDWLPDGWAQAELVDDGTGAAYWRLTPGVMRAAALELVSVTFDPANGADEPFVVTVQRGDPVSEQPAPAVPAGRSSFLGWYEPGAPEDGESYDFDEPVLADLTLVARYSDQYLVQYKNGAGKVIHSERLDWQAPVREYRPGVEDLELEEGQVFTYWYLEGGDENQPYQFGQPINGNLTLIPYLSSNHYVVFQTTGGSPVDPVLVGIGQPVDQPGVAPARTGYQFLHWSQAEDGPAYDFGQPVMGNLTLYAVWKGEQVPYRVVYWVESANLPNGPQSTADYTFVHTETRQATAGSRVSTRGGSVVVAADGTDEPFWDPAGDEEAQAQRAIRYASFAGGSEAEVKGDGTGTVNVYYDRNVYTYVFDLGDELPNAPGTVPGLLIGGRRYEGNEYRIKAKFEQDISGLWPKYDHLYVYPQGNRDEIRDRDAHDHVLALWTTPDDVLNDRANSDWATERTRIGYDMLPLDPGRQSVTVTAKYEGTAHHARYFFEMLDYDVPIDWNNPEYELNYDTRIYGEYAHFNNRVYQEDPAFSTTLFITTTLGPKDIEGFWSSKYMTHLLQDPDGPDTTFLFYDRNSYRLYYDLGGAGADYHEDYMYQQPLWETDEPTRDGYIFAGWYTHPEFKGEGMIDWETATMPAHDMTLYAHWDSTDCLVSFYRTSEGDWRNYLGEQGVAYGHTVDFSRAPLKAGDLYEGREFIGWLYKNANGALVQFPEDAPVYLETLDLYANWQSDGFVVRYDPAEGAGSASDASTYKLGAHARLQPADGVTPPAGQVFVGWRVDALGKSLYPYNFYEVRRDTDMVARYVPAENAHQLTYDANNGTGQTISYHVENGELVELMGGGVFRNPGYDQVGWSLKPDGTADHAFGEGILLSGDTVLYAVWEGDGVWHTVTFVSNGGTAVPQQTVNNGNKAERPDDPTRRGHRFDGWFRDDALREAYDFDTPLYEDLTLYAAWTEITGGGGGGGNTGGGGNGGSSGGGDRSTVTIPDAQVPLGNLVEIIDDDVPLGTLPRTGKTGRRGGSLLGAVALLLGGLGLIARREEDEE